jgi:HD-GYP domain-containing protein (c-di-GMP phosphodiesterase class II)
MDFERTEDEPRRYSSRGLRLKLLLSFSLLIVVTTAIMFWLTYDSTSRLAADKVRHRVALLTNVFAMQVNQEIASVKAGVELLADDKMAMDLHANSSLPRDYAYDFLHNMALENAYFLIYDAKGRLMCINADHGAQSAKIERIAQTLEKIRISKRSRTFVFRAAPRRENINKLYIATRIFADDGALRGFIVLEKKLATAQFGSIVRDMDIGGNGMDAYLVDASGVILSHPDPKLIGANVFGPGMPLESMRGKSAAKSLAMLPEEFDFKIGREKFLGASMPVNTELGWKIVLIQPYDEIAAAVARIGQRILFVGALALVTAFGLALYRAHRVLMPIGELLNAVDEISRGEYSKRVKVRRRDEIGSLALAFNRMSGTLEEKINALQESQAQLREAFHQLQIDARKREETNQQLRRKVSELTSISEITQAVSASLDLQTVLDTIVRTINDVMGFRYCSIKLLDVKSGTLLVRVASGLGDEYVNRPPTAVGKGISGRAVQERAPVIIESIDTDDSVEQAHVIRSIGIRSMVSFPLITKNSVMGVLNIYSEEEHTFTEDEMRMLAILAIQAASAIENARLFDDLRESYLNTIQALSMTIDAKDAYTHGHSKRVSDISVLVGNELKMDNGQLELLKYASDLHDIGKIGIPEHIISKEGKLSVDEYEIVKTHPLVGETIVEPVPFLNEIKDVIRHHHERYDGFGYPDGLKGDDIPLMSRIILIADAYDAMTSDRPYRRALSHEAALKEIEKHSGTQFDPEVAAAFMRVFGNRDKAQEVIKQMV